MPGSREVDTVVIGGGPAGISTALSLVALGESVVVLERSNYGQARIGETFPPAINHALARLGLGEALAAVPRVSSVGVRSVWGSADAFDRSFLFDPYGNGWHADRRAFDAGLAGEASRRGARLSVGTKLLDLRPNGLGGWILELAVNGEPAEVSASFVVDATGRASAVARRLGAGRTVKDNLVGVYGFFAGAQDDDVPAILLVEAVEDGWWYSAPLPNHRLVVAFMTDGDLCGHAVVRQESAWIAKMQQAEHTWARVSRCSPLGARRVFPANSSRLGVLCGPGWLAVGDAAVARDPLSGDGVYRSLTAGAIAAEAIHASRSGDPSAVSGYGKAVEKEFDVYLEGRRAYYAREPRWRRSPFWARRHSPGVRPSFTR